MEKCLQVQFYSLLSGRHFRTNLICKMYFRSYHSLRLDNNLQIKYTNCAASISLVINVIHPKLTLTEFDIDSKYGLQFKMHQTNNETNKKVR